MVATLLNEYFKNQFENYHPNFLGFRVGKIHKHAKCNIDFEYSLKNIFF